MNFSLFGILPCAGEDTCGDCTGGRLMFRIKICGVMQGSDIDDVVAAGADAVGLNFHPPSIRFIARDRATALSVHAAAAGLTRVGVFVDATSEQIVTAVEEIGLDFVQLHGNQTIADVEQLTRRGCAVIRVIRLPSDRIDPELICRQVAPWQAVGCALLLDADVGAAAGGMGMRLDWDAVGQWAQHAGSEVTWALAGGLTPELVGEAIRRTGARRIDVASGVESPRGKKSQPEIAALVSAALSAWRCLPENPL